MYPFSDDMNFPTNQWYVAAWKSEVSRELMARTILSVPIVFYRTMEGKPVAMDNRCPHRRFPLSKGRLEGDSIQCGYHGFTFDCSGKCIRIPSQEKVPPAYGARAFPLVERWDWIWIWMGDPALVDESRIPDHGPLHVLDEGWIPEVGGHELVAARYIFLQDNLLDLTHVSFLHGDTIGSPGVSSTEAQIEQYPDRIEIARYIKSDQVEHLPLAKALSMTGLADRDMVQQFFPPGLHCTGSDFRSAEKDGVEPGKRYGGFRVIHGLTPESETTTHYFWAFCRDFGAGNEVLATRMKTVIYDALLQDKVGVSGCEEMIQAGPLGPEIHARADAAALRGRKAIEALILAERS